MDKIKKVLGFLVFPLLLLLMFFPTGEAQAATNVTDKAKFEDLKITVAETGSESTGIHGESETQVALKFSGKFSFPNVTVNEIKDGDYFIVKAPDNLSLKDETMDLIDTTSNTKMGTVQVDNSNHQLKFTFNAQVENKQNIRGDFVAQAVETVTKEEKTVTYVIPGGKTQQITYIVKKYPKASIEGELLNKYSSHHTSLPKINYYMKFNRSKTDMGNHVVEIKDDLSKGAFANYIESSFTLYEAEYKTTDTNDAGLTKLGKEYKITTDPAVYQADSDHKALLTYTNGKRSFVLRMPTNMGTKSFLFQYSTTSPADGSTVTNTAQYLIDNQPQLIWKTWGGTSGTQKETTINTKSVKSAGASVTADIAGRIKIVKYDEADANVKLEGVVFEIFEKDTKKLVDTVTTNKDGIAMSKVLKDGKYIVKEKTPKLGYIVNSKEFEVEMKGGEGVPLSIPNKRETVDFEATKTWVGGNKSDYKQVKLGLYVHKKGQTVADSKPVSGNYTPEVTESNGVYTYKWKNQLPKYDVDGTTELVYSVRELQDQTDLPLQEGEKVKVGENNYVVSYNANKTQVTNTYEVPKIKVTANKVWVGGQERVRPTFYFKLYRTPEGGAIEEVAGAAQKEVPKTDGTVEWTDLPATDEHGVKYTYSVMEVDEDGNLIVDPIDGYTPSQTGPLTITNTYSASPTEADIKVKKALTGNRPTPLQANEFEFILKDKDGQEVQRAKNDANGDVVFRSIKFTAKGEYKYTVVEAKGGQTIDGVTHDARKVPVRVIVTDDGQGNLDATVMYDAITPVTLPAANFGSLDLGLNIGSLGLNTAIDVGIQTFTNKYKPNKVKAPVSATKSFINKNTNTPIPLKGGEFVFSLLNHEGDPVEKTTNDADGNIKFKDLEFEKAGIYQYTIYEHKAGQTENGITYTTTDVEVTIEVTDDGKGTLSAKVSYYNNNQTIVNTYSAEKAKANLEVTKKLTGRPTPLKEGEFEFTLTDSTGKLEDTKSNDKNGKVKFKELEFTQAGTYTYTIKEVKAGTTENGITYDGKTVTATVTVTDDGQGELHATVAYTSDASNGDTTFTNTYNPAKVKAPVSATKSFINKNTDKPIQLKGGEFEFALINEDDEQEKTTKNDKDGNIDFGELEFNKTGVFHYTIIERYAGTTKNGITYSNKTVEVTIEVTDDGNGALKATVSYDNNEKHFENTYKAANAKANLEVTKKLTGRETEAQEGEFEFTLTDSAGVVKDTKKNDAAGNVKFDELEFDKVGTYTYTITETNGGKTINGIAHDALKVKVTVEVTDDGKGKLHAKVIYPKDTEFNNEYSASKAKATLEVTKKLTGRATEAQAGEFEFSLTDNQDNSVKDTAKNDKDGNVQFKELEFTKAGTYKYTIKEVKAGTTENGITYDNKTITATVTVTDDGKGVLSAEVTYDGGTTFTNTYSASKTKASLEATKELTGRELQDGEFEFTLTDSNNNLVDTVKNTKDGKVQFKELEFDTAGTYTYKIAEKSGDATGVTYDTKTITATVTVTDDGEGNLSASVAYDDSTPFSNTYTPAGDTSVTLGAKKVLEGKVLEAGKYSFVLKEGDKVLQTVTNDADGNVKFAPIAYNESQVGTHKYTISEVSGSETGITYDTTVHEVEVTVKKVSATELTATVSKEAKDLVFTNKYTPGKTQIPVKKVWNDADNQDGKRPDSITVKLLADGQDTGKTLELNKENNWSGSFTDLDVNKAGKAIAYSVVEVTVTGYNSEVTGDAVSGFTITNSYTPETVNIKATKNWDDANNQDGKRPTKITVNLLADGTKVDSKEIQAAPDGTWSVEFTNLAKYKNGKEIKYTVTEEAVAEYDSYINDFNITNKYTPKTIDYKVTKVWKDANNQDGKRPESVTVQLYKKVGDADPVAVEGKKLTLTAKDKTDANTWVASFTNLPQFEAGKEITYSIKEVDVPAGYESSVTGQVVTNTHNPETVVLSGTKVWKDNNNQDGKRTTSVKVQILKGDQVVQEIEVSEKTGWKFESKPLPKYENGKEITYTVKEVAVKEYTSTVTTDKDGKYTVTNEYTPEKTSVKGKKIWNDANNKDGIRPDSIKVKLLADGKETGKEATASEATGWTYEFTELERYKDTKGTEFKYSVVEVPVKGYESKVEGFNITNTHIPEKPTPGKPNEPGKPGQKPQLPNTGEKASNATVVAGLALMAVTGGLYFVSRKNK